jgi:hypothetical protein
LESSKPPVESSYVWVYAVSLLASLILFGVGVYVAMHGMHYEMLAAGALAAVVVLVVWASGASVNAARRSIESAEHAEVNKVLDRLHQIAGLLTILSEQQLLSDRAKAVAYRDKDRKALRNAIREEMNAKDWDAALVLANDMESQFGYAQEAAVLRAEINNNRTEVVTRQIADSAAVIDQHVTAERWTQALREAERIQQIYPNDERAKAFPTQIETRRQAHKRTLLEGWKEAVARNDVDGSIEILKKVDIYLTPAEAASMQESARDVFKARLNNLKDSFSTAVHKEQWANALRIADQITAEHPNSRLALEVRDMMDSLRQRATRHTETV